MLQTPLRASDPRPRVEHCLFREWLMSNERRYTLAMGYTAGYPASSCRNRIVEVFLDSNSDFLVMLDDDQAPTSNPLDYIENDLDVIGFPYPTVRINATDNIIPWFPSPPESTGLRRVDFIGGGCMVIARRVLEHPGMTAAFRDTYDARGVFTEGEDIAFCRRATENGFAIWCAMDKPLLHIKPAEMLRVWSYANGQTNTDGGL